MTISTHDFVHPLDEAARSNLEAIPGFAPAMKTFLKFGYEKLIHGMNLASKIRLSEKQLPDLHARLPPICRKLGVAVPDFYLEMNPAPNAYTYGDSRISLTVTSGLLEYLCDEELDAVLAHECGHIACRHVLYHTMASLMEQGAERLGFVAEIMVQPIQLALLHWNRCSELSADRAAAAALGSPRPVVQTMIRLAGGPRSITAQVDPDEYASQADEYEKLKSEGWDRLLQMYATKGLDHPFTSVRTREILGWCGTDHFQRLQRNLELQESGVSCTHCGKPIDPAWKFCKACGAEL